MIHAVDTAPDQVLALTSWPHVLSALKLEAAEHARALADLAQLKALCEAADSESLVPVSPAELTNQRLPRPHHADRSCIAGSVYT